MNDKQIQKLKNKYLRDLVEKENLIYHKRLLILPCKEPLLRAILFERLTEKESFICSWFVIPLFIKTDILTWSLGSRFSSSWRVSSSNKGYIALNIESDIKSVALPVLKHLSTVSSIIDYLVKNNLEKQYRNTEILLHCAIWLKDKNLAKKYFKLTKEYFDFFINEYFPKAEMPVPKEEFEKRMDCENLYNTFLKNPADAKKLLEENISYTLSHLKLPKGLWPEYEK